MWKLCYWGRWWASCNFKITGKRSLALTWALIFTISATSHPEWHQGWVKPPVQPWTCPSHCRKPKTPLQALKSRLCFQWLSIRGYWGRPNPERCTDISLRTPKWLCQTFLRLQSSLGCVCSPLAPLLPHWGSAGSPRPSCSHPLFLPGAFPTKSFPV